MTMHCTRLLRRAKRVISQHAPGEVKQMILQSNALCANSALVDKYTRANFDSFAGVTLVVRGGSGSIRVVF